MLNVFDALDRAEEDDRLASLNARFIADELGTTEFESEVEHRLDELLHADELDAQMVQQRLEDTIELDLQRMGYPRK